MKIVFRLFLERLLRRWLNGHGLLNRGSLEVPESNADGESVRTFLHVGCGAARQSGTTPGFAQSLWREIRFDIDASVDPDILGSIVDMVEVPDGAVSGVFSSHNIEHLEAHEVPIALAEFHRVLMDDGLLVLRCPDLQTVARWVADGYLDEPEFPTAAGPVAPLDMIYGFRPALAKGDSYMAHRTGFVLPMLVRLVREAGFRAVHGRRCEDRGELLLVASKALLPEDAISQCAALHFP